MILNYTIKKPTDKKQTDKMENKKIQNMKTEELAKWLHDNYEEIAKKKGWISQSICKVEFKDLPSANKQVMMSMARKIHKNIK